MSYEKKVVVRLPPKDSDDIKELVEKGYAMNETDFVRQAIRDKVSKCKAGV